MKGFQLIMKYRFLHLITNEAWIVKKERSSFLFAGV